MRCLREVKHELKWRHIFYNCKKSITNVILQWNTWLGCSRVMMTISRGIDITSNRYHIGHYIAYLMWYQMCLKISNWIIWNIFALNLNTIILTSWTRIFRVSILVDFIRPELKKKILLLPKYTFLYIYISNRHD